MDFTPNLNFSVNYICVSGFLLKQKNWTNQVIPLSTTDHRAYQKGCGHPQSTAIIIPLDLRIRGVLGYAGLDFESKESLRGLLALKNA